MEHLTASEVQSADAILSSVQDCGIHPWRTVSFVSKFKIRKHGKAFSIHLSKQRFDHVDHDFTAKRIIHEITPSVLLQLPKKTKVSHPLMIHISFMAPRSAPTTSEGVNSTYAIT
jgi:hypothetical protein